MTFGWVHKRRPARLRNIQIDSVDSVSKGASPGATVVFMKSDNERNDTMSELGPVSVAKRSVQALDAGEISQETYAKLQQRIAQEMFPSDSMGVALAKFFATPHGSEMLNRGLKKSYVDLQKRTALANTDVLKAAKPVAHAEKPDDDENDEGAGGETEPWDKKIANLMKEKNISYDAAASILHRAERVRKIGW